MHEINPELIKACIKKDTRAEYALYKECHAMLIGICNRYATNKDDAVDLLNRGFLKLLNNLEQYDESRAFTKWARSIMINTIIDEFRASKTYRKNFSLTGDPALSTEQHALDVNAAESKISVEEMLREIQKLPDGSREVFNLYVFEGMNHKEISKELQIPEGTSRWLLSNARVFLRKRLSSLLSSVRVMIW